MMTNTITRIPAMAGATLLSTLGRTFVWVFKKYAAAPLTSTAVVALTVGLALAANNALFAQVEHHPAPFFFGSPDQVAASNPSVEIVPPVTIAPPPTRSVPLAEIEPAPVVTATPTPPAPVVTQQPTGDEVSNSELADAQRKLQSMGLFDGEIDGFYGPKTAEAIRAFEMRNGMTPKGDMSRPVIAAILRASSSDSASIEQARTTARALETVAPPAVVESAPVQTSDEVVAGQRALQALIAPPAEITAQTPEPAETFVASVENAAPAQPVAAVPVTSEEAGANPFADNGLIERIQTGLSNLGFLHSRIDGVAGEETARAIRNFEVFHNYQVTGSVSPELVDLLTTAGAYD